MPTHREDREAAGSQHPAADADLQPAEERQDDQDQRGARSVLPLLAVVACVQCVLCSEESTSGVGTAAAQGCHLSEPEFPTRAFQVQKGKSANESREKKSADSQKINVECCYCSLM